MKPFSFNELTLYVPELWGKPWDEYIEESDGIAREFIAVQAAYARALRRIDSQLATPEKIAWLSLWSRHFGALTGARGAVQWHSKFAASVMERVTTEAALHLDAVMLPALESKDGLGEHVWAAIRNRLRGYLAWCLHGDELLYNQFLDQRILDAAFDPKPERALIEQLGPSIGAWEKLSGEQFEVVSDQEAFHDRKRAEESITQRRNRTRKWLSDPRLRSWVEKIRALDHAPDKRGALTLFSVFSLSPSVSSFLRRRAGAAGYIGYLAGSAYIHGSSLEASMLATDDLIAPNFADFGGGLDTTAHSILSDGRLSLTMLQVLAGQLDPNEHGE